MIVSDSALAKPEPHRSLTSEVAERALDVLICFIGADGELGVSEIARRLGIDKSSVHRFLMALKHKGFVVDNPRTRRYSLGFRALELGRALTLQMNLEQQALPFLRELRDVVGETTGLSVRVGNRRVHIIQAESTHEIRRSIQIGSPLPLHVGANGKILLAALPAEEREPVLEASLAEGPPMSLEDVEDLRRELQETARRGYSITEGERVPGSRSMAAPVWTGRGDTIALLVSGPDGRFSHEVAVAAIPYMLDVAHRLTRQLGGHQPAH
jgi:IclR family KDG regulon transcriptional repressor